VEILLVVMEVETMLELLDSEVEMLPVVMEVETMLEILDLEMVTLQVMVLYKELVLEVTRDQVVLV